MIVAFKVSAEIMDLGMAIVTGSDAIIGSGSGNLVKLDLAETASGFRVAALQSAAASTAAVIVGAVGSHIHKVFLSHHPFDHEPQIFSIGVAVGLAHLIAGVLSRKFNLPIFVPVGVDPELSLTDPFGV
jgi:hypothetical protein